MHGHMISLNGFPFKSLWEHGTEIKFENAFRFDTETSIQFSFDYLETRVE